MFATELTTEYHKIRQRQSQIIGDCLQHLHSIGITYHFDFNHFDAATEYAAWEFTKKHWAKFKKAGIPWIKAGQYKSHYALKGWDEDGGTVINLSKAESHCLYWEVDSLICDCEAFEYSGHCSHVEFALDELGERPVEVSANATVTISDGAKARLFEVVKPDGPTDADLLANEYEGNTDEDIAEQIGEGCNVEILPGIIGTAGQVQALTEIVRFVQGDKALHGLIGAAGTGKTTVLQAAIKALRDLGWEGRIAMTAPSNKATGVMQAMIDRWGLGIEAQTCHKLLGLKPEIDKDGNQVFKPDKNNPASISEYQLVIVDEGSMVNEELWSYFTANITFFTKLLFVGDYCQLPPVNEAISKVFLEIEKPSWLDEVKRYDGAIAKLADDVRRNLSRQQRPHVTTNVGDNGKGIYLLKRKRWESALIKAFNSETYRLDPSRVKCLAYTNKRVEHWNKHIRDGIYGQNVPRFQQGDRLIAKKPFSRQYMGETEGFSTSAEMEVLTAIEGWEGSYKAWHLTCMLFDAVGTRITFPVLHQDSYEQFRECQEKLKAQKQHLAYHANLEHWAWVDYAYCITVHNAQGSTYRDLFIDNKNVFSNKTRNKFTWPDGREEFIWERNQLWYVAMTRPTHRVFVYE
jgi:hypothetical protein